MGDAFRGLTIRLGADVRPLDSALRSISHSASAAQKQLTAVSKALKFDGNNVNAMRMRLDLVNDKALLTARSVTKIQTAMRQAANETLKFSQSSGLGERKMSQMAAETKQVYAATQKLRSEYVHTDAELAHIYEAMAKVHAEEKKISFDKALKQVKSLAKAYDSTTAAGKKAHAIINHLVKTAAMTTDVAEKFNLEKVIGVSQKLLSVYIQLRKQHNALGNDLESMKAVEGFRALQSQLIAAKSEMRQTAAEAARFRTELHMLGTNGHLAGTLSDIKRISEASSAATAHARQMAETYALVPKSAAAAKAKIDSLRMADDALENSLTEIRNALRKIENDPAFDKQAANARGAYTNAVKVENAYATLKAKITMAEAAQENLNAELKEMDKDKAKKTSEEFVKLQNKILKVDNAIDKLKTELASLDKRHAAAALITQFHELQSAEARCVAETVALKTQMNALQHLAGNLRTMGYGLYSTLTPTLMILGRYAVQAANDVDAAYRNMRKTVNGTEEEFEHLRDAALAFGRTHVTSASEILEIEAIGGQLGIAAQNLEKFSEVVSNVDIATNLDTETISQNFGQLSNIMKDMNQDLESGPGSLEAFSDSLVRLGNNSATQEDRIMAVMMRIASMGTISEMATPDLLALATATAATGQGAEAAGTALSRTFSNIEAAVGKGGEKLEKFAEVSHMTSAEFATAWKERPMEAFQAFINGLKDIDDAGDSVANTLSELGINGVRQRQTLMGLTNTTDILANSLIMSNNAWNGVGDSWGDAGDAAREASRKAEGFSGQLKIMKNTAQELGVQLLDSSVPMIKMLASLFQSLSAAFANMPDFVKTFTVKFALMAAAAGPVLVAFGALVDGATKVGAAFEAMKGMWNMRTVSNLGIEKITASLEANQLALDKNAAALEMRKTALARVEAAEIKELGTTQAASAAKQRYVAVIEEESAALQANRAKLEADRVALEKDKLAYKEAAVAANMFKTALKGIGSVAGVMIAFEILGQAIAAIGSSIEKMQNFEKATKGLAESASEFVTASRNVRNGVKEQSDSLDDSASAYDQYKTAVDDAVQGSIKLAETFKDNKESADVSASVAENYANKIIELTENWDGSAESIALLNDYVASFNMLTGASVKVIDEKNGKLSVGNDVIMQNIELLKKQAYAEAAKKNAEAATSELAKQQAVYNALLQQQQDIMDEYDSKTMNEFQRGERSGRLTEVQNKLKEMKPVIEELEATEKSMWDEYEKSTASASRKTKELGDSMIVASEDAEAMTDEMEDMVDALDGLESKSPQFAKMYNEWGLGAEQFMDLLDQLNLSFDDVSKGVEEMADKVSDGFNEIEVNAELSLDKYLETLAHNKEVTAAWGENMKTLYNKSSDETYQAWVRELAKAGPEASLLLEDMTKKEASELEALAGEWQDAKDMGAVSYLDSVALTSAETQRIIADMVASTKSILGELNGLDVEYYVDDAGTIRINKEKLEDFDREALADKGFIVKDDGTLIDMTEKCKSFNVVKIDDKYFYVSDDGTIYNEKGEIDSLNDKIGSVQRVVTTYFQGDMSDLSSVISSVKAKIAEAKAAANAQGGIYMNASGGLFASSIRALPRHADGGLNGIVTRATLTNVGWVGEAGDEALIHMKHAGGAIIPLSNRQHVRPFARAVAAEMSNPGPKYEINLTIPYNASDDVDEFARVMTRKLNAIMDMRG